MQAEHLEDHGDWEAARHVRDQAWRLDHTARQGEAQRLEHLERAAKLLEEGGFTQEAEQLHQKAAELQRELTERNCPGIPAAAIEELRELRQSINQLTAEIAELRLALGQLQRSPEPTLAPTASPSAPRALHRSAEIPNEDLDAPVPRLPGDKAPAAESGLSPTPAKGGSNGVEFEFELIPLEPTPAPGATAPQKSAPAVTPVPTPTPTPVSVPTPRSVQ
jgi:hypothetical protein